MAPLLEVRHLKKFYPLPRPLFARTAGCIRAVDDVSFHLDSGETLGLVGDSGCGKTTLGRAILRLVTADAGAVLFSRYGQTHDVLRLPGRQLRALRRHMQIVFQDPYRALNPRVPVGVSVAEGMEAQGMYTRAERRARVGQLLERVGLDPAAADRYPHAFSGGQRQRLGIARALAVEPTLLICDEVVSALDASVQAQVLNLLLDLQRERHIAYLFIAHDLAVVAHVSQRVAVMHQGQLVEIAATAELFARPAHPYTRALLSAVPKNRSETTTRDEQPVTGCPYQPRCPEALAECAHVEPPLIQLGEQHQVRCHLWKGREHKPGGEIETKGHETKKPR